MRYACRVLSHALAPEDLEAKLNEAAIYGWECAGVTQRHADLLIVFRGDFSNLGDFEIATNLLDSAI